MCGRITITSEKVESILKRFKADPAPNFTTYVPRFNAAPTQFVPVVVTKEDGKRYLTNAYWGFTPPWAETEGSKYSMQINIRSDTIERNRYFKGRLLSNRCIFVADGFYEWQTPSGTEKKTAGKGVRKIPYRITLKSGEIFPLAGLWRTIEEKNGETLTGAIITTRPNRLMSEIHNRMPVILSDASLAQWLDPSVKDFPLLKDCLEPYPEKEMKAYVVSTAVNNSRLDSPACIQPAS